MAESFHPNLKRAKRKIPNPLHSPDLRMLRSQMLALPMDEQEYNNENDNAHFSEDDGKESEKVCVKPTVVTIGKKS